MDLVFFFKLELGRDDLFIDCNAWRREEGLEFVIDLEDKLLSRIF